MSDKTMLVVLAVVALLAVVAIFAALVWLVTWPLRKAIRHSISSIERGRE